LWCRVFESPRTGFGREFLVYFIDHPSNNLQDGLRGVIFSSADFPGEGSETEFFFAKLETKGLHFQNWLNNN